MEQTLGFSHFLANADGVALFILVTMAFASVVTWYLIITKSIRLQRLLRRSEAFLSAFWDAPNIEAVAAHIRETGTTDPFSHLLHHGFTAIEQQRRHQSTQNSSLIEAGAPDDLLTRALKRAIEEDKNRLEFGQSFLATVASSAPFVGLFGTVWGIYHALIAIGLSGQGTLDKVAGPVGEALIMTGIGLAVAIPAAISYNTFARANATLLSRLNAFAYDVFAFMSTGIKTSAMLTDSRDTSERVIALSKTPRTAHPSLAH